jgi:hypothetical protein
MHRFNMSLRILLASAPLLLCGPRAGAAATNETPAAMAPQTEKALTNAEVLALTQSGFAESIVVQKVQQAPLEALEVSTEALIALKEAGVGQATIDAMLKRVARRAESQSAAHGESAQRDSPPRWQVWKRGTKPAGQTGTEKKGSDVKLYLTDKPSAPFRELQRVSAGKYNFAGITRDRGAIDEELRKKAAAVGADAVINITEDFANVSGVAIAFTQPPG